MAFTNKLDAVAKAEQLLLAAGLDVDAIADIVAVLADDATSLEKVNIYMAGDLAVAKLKTLLKGQGVRAQGVASKGLQLFAEMAPKATREGDWLTVDAHLLGDPSLGCTMYVREAYIELRKVLESLKERGIGHVVVSGNPGLGKSWFAIYMLISWLQEGLHVLWHSPRSFLHFDKGTVSILSEEDAVQMLSSGEDPNLRYIADGVAPLFPSVKVVQSLVAHSPDQERYKEYMKPRGHLAAPLWMPFWEIHELEAVRQKLSPQISRDQMLQLIGRRGEVPSYVLDKADQTLMDNSIDTAIESLRLEDITAAAPGTAQASHRIAKIHPPHWRDGNFADYELSFLRVAIKEKVAVKVLQIVANDASRLMALTNKSMAGLAGILGACINECLTHPQLKAGGTWQKRLCPSKGNRGPVEMRTSVSSGSTGSTSNAEELLPSRSEAEDSASNMTTAVGDESDTGSNTRDSGNLLPGAEVLVLPPLPVRFIWTAEDLYSLPHGDQYVQPESSNFEAIKSIAIVGTKAYLFQITQDAQHDVKTGLLNVLACLPEQLEVEFVWVLPPNVWASQTFNKKDLPQKPSPDSPAADRWALVEQRLRACQQQYKIPVKIGYDVPPSQVQPSMSLLCGSLASRMIIRKTTPSGVKGLNMGPRTFHLPPVRLLARPGLHSARVLPSSRLPLQHAYFLR